MKPMSAAIRQSLSAVLACFALAPAISHSATFSTELDFAVTAGPFGEYLTASYDFGAPFRDVQLITLEVDIPGGYQGTAMSTGNSSLFKGLLLQIHDPSDSPPVEYFSQFLGSSAFNVPPGSPAEFSIGRLEISAGETTIYADWPTFLLSGSGNVSLMEQVTSSYHPLPHGDGGWSRTSWLPPPGIAGARLIIEASPVPEPSAIAIVLVGAATLRCFRMG